MMPALSPEMVEALAQLDRCERQGRRQLYVTTAIAVLTGIALTFALGCGAGSPTGPTAEPTMPPSTPRTICQPEPLPADRVYGYYAYEELSAGCGWSNWTLVASATVEEAEAQAQAARRCGQQVTWADLHGATTSSRWDWAHLKPIVQVYADACVLHSVYVADEPLAAGWMDAAEIARRVADVHAAGWQAMLVEQGGGVNKPHPAIDYYGMDWYDARPHAVRAALQRHPEINVLVVPAFRWPDGSLSDQDGWVGLARERHVGVAFWMWPTVGRWTGTVDVPELQAAHRRLWASR